MSHDPVSSILALAETRASTAGGFVTGGVWALAFPPPSKIKFFTIVRGKAFLRVEGSEKVISLQAGDVVLLSAPKSFVLGTDLTRQPLDALEVFPIGAPTVVQIGEGDDFFLMGGHVDLDALSGRILLDSLPSLIRLQAGGREAEKLQWLIGQLVEEFRGHEAGSGFACSGLAQLMFLQILRGYLSRSENSGAGWLRAISDLRIARALAVIHDEPAREWHLPDLAKAAGMSRTAFATRFREIAGVTPLAYVTQWRMHLAERALRDGETTIAMIAQSVGYASEAAFSNAFKRIMGASPTRFRTHQRQELTETRKGEPVGRDYVPLLA
ncbi:AraC family transcriptional regulator [Gluconobacter oxydans]|nr:transcriptional regulator [Gluconobacter oxydans H24]ANQ43071.1 AraC family transcriptional regulator [Gluconobacter oxydans]